MTGLTKYLVLFSIGLNCLFLVAFIFLVVRKWNSISDRLRARFFGIQPTEKVLATFNREPYQFVNEKEIFDESAKTISILFLGNSLTYTEAPEEEPDKTYRGLTSTTKDKDYVHQLVKRISQEKKVNVIYSLTNIADFERHIMDAPFDFSWFSQLTVKNPDYVIFQIGENVSKDEIMKNTDIFVQHYSQVVSHFENAVKIVCLPWWQDAEKNMLITQVAINTKSYLVDISHLGSGADKRNFAESYKNYKVPGVRVHPGDYGMKNIADCIWTVFNAE